MAMTRGAKERLKRKAKEKSLEASDLARRGTRKMIRLVEEEPERTLKLIRKESNLYQPPRTGGYQYGYQFYVRVETKRLLERVRALLTRQAGRGQAATAGRRVIEGMDTGPPPLCARDG